MRQSQQRIQANHLEKLGITPAQAKRRRAYWQRRMKFERALRKLWRLTMERRKVAQSLRSGEAYLTDLAHLRFG